MILYSSLVGILDINYHQLVQQLLTYHYEFKKTEQFNLILAIVIEVVPMNVKFFKFYFIVMNNTGKKKNQFLYFITCIHITSIQYRINILINMVYKSKQKN